MRPSALARQLHPRGTFGFISGLSHKAGSGKGCWWPWHDIPAAQAGPVCPAVLEVPTGSKALEVQEGAREAPSQRRSPHSRRRYEEPGTPASTPLPVCRWENEGPAGGVARPSHQVLWVKAKDPVLLMRVEAASALREPGGVRGSQGSGQRPCGIPPHSQASMHSLIHRAFSTSSLPCPHAQGLQVGERGGEQEQWPDGFLSGTSRQPLRDSWLSPRGLLLRGV